MSYILLAIALSGDGYPYRVARFETQYRCEQAKGEVLKADRKRKHRYICVRR